MTTYTAFSLLSGKLPWQNVAVNTNMVAENGYIVTATCSLTLPLVSGFGDELDIVLLAGVSFTILQNNVPAQSIRVLGGTTTPGAGGNIFCNTLDGSLRLICTVANTTWIAISEQSNLFVT